MKRSIAIFSTGILFLTSVFSQTGADDYWLNNGFTNGETVITNSGWFYDDGGDDVYHQGQDWTVTFCSENGNPITLDFSNFKTHFGGIPGDNSYPLYDYMSISIPGQGNYVAYDNDTPEFSFTSATGCITISFHSDNDGQIDSGWVAEIYAIPPPDNNDPSTAEELIVGNVCSPSYYSNKGAYNTTNLGNPPCKEYFGGDVWFTLEVPASGEVKIETFAGSLTYAILDIYRSTDSNITSGERIACVDDAGAMPSVTLASPTVNPGDILYIRLFGEQAKSGLFGICASDPSSPVTGYTGPGGVGNAESLDYWFKADSGVLNSSDLTAANGEAVRTWKDQSGNGRDLIQTTGTNQSTLNSSAINGIPGLVFDGTDDLYELESGSGDAPMHWFAAASFSGAQRQTMVSVGDVLASKTASIGRHSDGRYYSYTSGDLYGPLLSLDQYYIFNVSHESASPYHFLELDGLSQTVDADPVALESDGSLQLGAAWDKSDPYQGTISELIQYNKKLNSTQEIIVNNYLAAKYNITLDDNNYYPYKSTFPHDVAGIGRLNVSSFHTKAQSAGILSISGANNLGNDEFLFFGHNNGDISTWNSTNVPAGDTNIVRLDRVWRVVFIGDPGNVTIGLQKDKLPALPAGFVSYNILVDANGDFSSGAVAYGPFDLGDEMLANNIDVDDGDFIAIAAVRPVLSFSSANYAEYEDVANPVLQVDLNYAVSGVVEVAYAVTGGTATLGTDFQLLPSSVFINPGDLSAQIIPLIINDTEVEVPDEYFDVQISSPTSGITVGGIQLARHTILNEDLNLVLTPDVTVTGECASSFATIVAVATGTGPFNFVWTPSSGLDVTDNDTVHASPATTTTYSCEVTDGLGQTLTRNVEIQVSALPVAPVVSAGGPVSFCLGDSVQLTASSGYTSYLWSNGETTESIWAKSSGDYSVNGFDVYGCITSLSNTITVSVNAIPPAPSISPDGPLDFCDGDSVIFTAGGTHTSYTWSDNSTGTSLVAKSAGGYYVFGTDANGCVSASSDTIDVVIYNNPLQPLVSAGTTETCEGDSVLLSAPSGFVSYLWSDGTSAQSVYIKSSGDYNVIVTDANSCSSPASADLTITIHANPLAPLITGDGPLTFCDGEDVTLSGSGAYPVYTWSDGYLGQSRLVESSGEFAVKVTDGNLCESPYSDSVTVTERLPLADPDISVSGELNICSGDSTLLIAPVGYASYLWSDGSVNDTLVVKTTGDYRISVTDANSCTSALSDEVHIEVYPLPAKPVISSDGGSALCEGGTVILSVAGTFAGYSWSNGSTDPEISVSTSGTYTIHVTDANNCVSPESDVFDLQVNSLPEAPSVTADGALDFCEGLDVTLSASGSYPLYTWSDGVTGQNRTISLAGDYSVKVSDSNGCESDFSAIQTIVVYNLPTKPVIAAVGATEFCSGDSIILAGPSGYTAYLWSDGSTDDSIVVKSSSALSLTVTDDHSCESVLSDEVTITVNDNPSKPSIVVSGDTEFCDGESVTLEADAGYQYYHWSDNGSGQTRSIFLAGDYSVSVEDANGCISPESDPVNIIVHTIPEAPLVSPEGPEFVIIGDSIELTSSDAFEYLWSPNGQTTKSIYVKQSGNYFVQVSNEYGCTSAGSNIVAVTVSEFIAPPSVDSSGNLTFCAGGEVILIGEPGFATYSWSNGASGQELTLFESATVSLIVTDFEGHTSFPSEELTVTVNSLPVLNVVNATDPLCFGSSDGQIEVYASGKEPIAYSWQDRSETDNLLTGLSAGDYWAFASDANACSNGIHIELVEPDQITYTSAITPASCPDFADGSIQLQVSGGTLPYMIYWNSFESSGYENDLAAGDYSLGIVDGNDCSVDATITIGVESQLCFVIPEIITPNGDQKNDTWVIDGLEQYPNVTIEIFDRWGKRVFYSEGHNEYFDGTFNGKELPMESYHYVIDLHDGSERIIGNITIIRGDANN